MNKVIKLIKEKFRVLSPVVKDMFIEDLLEFIKNY